MNTVIYNNNKHGYDSFEDYKQEAMKRLIDCKSEIDPEIKDLIFKLNELPFLYTKFSCYGHVRSKAYVERMVINSFIEDLKLSVEHHIGRGRVSFINGEKLPIKGYIDKQIIIDFLNEFTDKELIELLDFEQLIKIESKTFALLKEMPKDNSECILKPGNIVFGLKDCDETLAFLKDFKDLYTKHKNSFLSYFGGCATISAQELEKMINKEVKLETIMTFTFGDVIDNYNCTKEQAEEALKQCDFGLYLTEGPLSGPSHCFKLEKALEIVKKKDSLLKDLYSLAEKHSPVEAEVLCF